MSGGGNWGSALFFDPESDLLIDYEDFVCGELSPSFLQELERRVGEELGVVERQEQRRIVDFALKLQVRMLHQFRVQRQRQTINEDPTETDMGIGAAEPDSPAALDGLLDPLPDLGLDGDNWWDLDLDVAYPQPNTAGSPPEQPTAESPRLSQIELEYPTMTREMTGGPQGPGVTEPAGSRSASASGMEGLSFPESHTRTDLRNSYVGSPRREEVPPHLLSPMCIPSSLPDAAPPPLLPLPPPMSIPPKLPDAAPPPLPPQRLI